MYEVSKSLYVWIENWLVHSDTKCLKPLDWLMPGASEESCIESQNVDTDQNDSTGKPLTSSHERLFEADRDYVGHETIVQDMCSYLRKKGKHNPEEYLSLPVR